MKLFCDTCQQQTPHTKRVDRPHSPHKVCKCCASLNRDPGYRFRPMGPYFAPRDLSIEETLRLYKQRGVKHAERLFPHYTGPRIITLEAFFKKAIDAQWGYLRFRTNRGNRIEIHGRRDRETSTYWVLVWQDKEIVEQHIQELDQKILEHLASLVQPGKQASEIKGYVAESGI